MVLSTDPIFFSIGPIHIYYYGLVYALTFLVLYLVFTYTKKKHLLNQDQIDSLFLHILIGMLVGGRVMHFLFADPTVFITSPLELLYIWHGGMSFFGAFLGIVVGVALFVRRNKLSVERFFICADSIALVATLGLIFGRMANFLNQELVGRVTDAVPWCVEFGRMCSVNISGEVVQTLCYAGCRHPYQIYASISHAILFVVLVFVYRRHGAKVGETFWAFIFGYCISRFVVDFWRDDAIIAIGLTSWQIVSLVVFVTSIFLYRHFVRHKRA
ncbi:MAG TPA: prolipoprotein diacylglyceryl transferase [Acidobacteriota bacterium]|nr:prolipoprotein diacylglyceryl transferase [Acidobacteriota bacterium]